MSIALDAALYLREQKLAKPLTTSERGALFTLLFRVGSNPYAWVSQEVLSIEMDIIERNVRNLMKSLSAKGFIVIEKSSADKRKNIYRVSEFLINYHQSARRQSTKKYRSKSAGIKKNTGRNQPVLLENTGRNQPVLSSENSSEVTKKQWVEKLSTPPKVTVALKDIKNSKVVATETVNNFYPNSENQRRADQVAVKCRTTGMRLITKFRELTSRSRPYETNLDVLFGIFLDKELPARKNHVFSKQAIDFL